MPNQDIDQEILNAHASNDYAALVQFYTQAAQRHETLNQADEACYFYTLAYVFALQEGMDEASVIHSRLKKYGREE